ncbi:MAG: DUF1214 domain-containing protein, partial [Pseudomonadota bacterium]
SIVAESASWTARIAAERPDDDANWISSRNSGGFDLLLRLYVPRDDLLERPETALTPPSIERLSCKGDAA